MFLGGKESRVVKAILVTLIACCFGLAGIASIANAQSEVGLCNSIVAQGAGPTGAINQGINVLENCNEILVVMVEFMAEGCDLLPEGSLFIEKIRAGALEVVCSAVQDTCGIPLDICS